MKGFWLRPAIAAGLGAWLMAAPAPAAEPAAPGAPAPAAPSETITTNAPPADTPAPSTEAPPASAAGTAAAPDAAPAPGSATEAEPAPVGPVPDGQLRLNFRDAPLDLVLNYLSDAAGFIINLETEVRGRVTVWSGQPLTKEEAVDVLNAVLNKNGYAALRNGRTLTIVGRDDAKKRDIPVITGSNPTDIPKTDDVVTQIVPVRYINAAQVARDLQPLLPSEAGLTANEGGNALVITDTQTNIRRMVEIVKALDTSVASIASVKVFPLKYADAKALATIVRDVFTTQETGRSSDPRAQFMARFGGGFRGGPGGGGDNAGGSGGSSGGRAGASRVVAVADERSNSLVVSAPEDLMPTVEKVVEAVDTNVEDVMELRVFALKNADPTEMADMLISLFPDETSTSNMRGGFRFGGPGMTMGGNRNASTDSDRMKRQSRVLAVPDPRTRSIVVSASHDMMEQITPMIAQLDADNSKKQQVYVFPVENSDPMEIEEILRGLFEGNNTRNTRSTRTSTRNQGAGTQLSNRASQRNTSSSGRTGTRTGSSGMGTR
ncbi:MAG TPA: secretin N-terminal domain-containing protein [Verrucomicrobiota bacterium]|nr:secretin N-terminal domain-containing protein [Verrucomicrobiota bacterium]HNU50551.1 secretin N-terminal domain-containing protein [Verrucomicrobiota bacterium]